MSKIWITSDWHFGHNKIFIWEARGFSSVEEMNEEIIKRHNSVVSPDDHVYVLGDLILGDDEVGIACYNRLNGWLHIVRGNHDSNRRWEIYHNGEKIVERENSIYLDYNKYHFYLSHYPSITSNSDYDKPLRQRLLNLCGHTHTTDKWLDADKGFIYHCEVDAHNCYPVLLDDIIEEFKQKFKDI